ncbi:hypothetical protein PCCS19_09500 [Paenibacillus sp. CCS19]|uniref:hypothetical protein n=1 Tax=Paenibacillus sp. CCS19 TaxID=3158387 RepID=UPI0025632B2E|nr:hypothetical protein [Paenibacillus cellulosilyticus]GMK37896.1 hypothetical protein PCCS19_09500 [Paenibacillus cellulosilyticus]
MSDRSTVLQQSVSGACHADHESALEMPAASEAALHINALPSGRGSLSSTLSRIFVQRRLPTLAGAILVLTVHAIHLLALPLLALLLGSQTGSDGTAPLFSHDNHTIGSSTASGLFGANGLLLKWGSDLLTAATIVTAIAMCRTTTRLWLRVRQHPLLCIAHTIIAAMCVWLAVN